MMMMMMMMMMMLMPTVPVWMTPTRYDINDISVFKKRLIAVLFERPNGFEPNTIFFASDKSP